MGRDVPAAGRARAARGSRRVQIEARAGFLAKNSARSHRRQHIRLQLRHTIGIALCNRTQHMATGVEADHILQQLFGVLRDRYIEPAQPKGLRLMPETLETEIAAAPDANGRARLVCDWIANMTDRFAFRTYRRLFDAEFGSITDFV